MVHTSKFKKGLVIPGDAGDTIFRLRLINGILGLAEAELLFLAKLIDMKESFGDQYMCSPEVRKAVKSNSNSRKYISKFVSKGIFVRDKEGNLSLVEFLNYENGWNGYIIEIEET